MIVKMEFSFPNGEKKNVGKVSLCYAMQVYKQCVPELLDMPYTADALANSRTAVINRCERYVYLDGCLTHNQNKVSWHILFIGYKYIDNR